MKIRTKVVGVTFSNEDGTNRQEILSTLMEGDMLELRDCSSARWPEAIGVFTSSGQQVGNLSKELAQRLRNEGTLWDIEPVTVTAITGGGADSYGCNILIGDEDEMPVRSAANDAPQTAPTAKAKAAPRSATRSGKAIQSSKKSRFFAILLCVVLGYLGVHRFYLGKKGTGVLWLLTIGLIGFGWAYDLIMLVLGKMKDAQGKVV